MTRIASSDRRRTAAACPFFDVRWRVGVRGRLNLIVRAAREAADTSDQRVRVEVTLDHDGGRLHAAFDGSIRMDRSDSGTDATIEFSLTEPHRGECRATLLLRDGITPVLLTDLPTRLGLRGGTYVVEQLRIEPAAWQAGAAAFGD
jgi:hypothetical protein